MKNTSIENNEIKYTECDVCGQQKECFVQGKQTICQDCIRITNRD